MADLRSVRARGELGKRTGAEVSLPTAQQCRETRVGREGEGGCGLAGEGVAGQNLGVPTCLPLTSGPTTAPPHGDTSQLGGAAGQQAALSETLRGPRLVHPGSTECSLPEDRCRRAGALLGVQWPETPTQGSRQQVVAPWAAPARSSHTPLGGCSAHRPGNRLLCTLYQGWSLYTKPTLSPGPAPRGKRCSPSRLDREACRPGQGGPDA